MPPLVIPADPSTVRPELVEGGTRSRLRTGAGIQGWFRKIRLGLWLYSKGSI